MNRERPNELLPCAKRDADAGTDARAFEEIGSPYEAARCTMAQSQLFARGKGKAPARGAALAEAARSVFATLGAAGVES